MKRFISFVVVFSVFGILFTSKVIASEWYVSPSGTSDGDGSLTSPWDLQTSLNQPASVQPGDTIWLRGGTYSGLFTSTLNGNSGNYITVKQYPDERAILDGGNTEANGFGVLTVTGSYTNYQGFEITSSNVNRTSSQAGSAPTDINNVEGVYTSVPNNRFINLVIHDVNGDGISSFGAGGTQEWYGNLIYNVGWTGSDGGHGHSIYSHNYNGGLKQFNNNILLRSMSDYNTHVYSQGNYLKDYSFDRNISSGGIFLIGGGLAASNINLSNNAFFDSRLKFGYTANDNVDLTLTNNYLKYPQAEYLYWQDIDSHDNTFIADATTNGNVLRLDPDTYNIGDYTGWNNNTYYNTNVSLLPFLIGNSSTGTYYNFDNWKTATGFDAGSTYYTGNPTGVKIFIFPNLYDSNKAHVAIYNWHSASKVFIDLSTLNLTVGTTYRLRNSYNYFNEYYEFTYNGGLIEVPMTGWTVVSSTGGLTTNISNTFPEFGAFILDFVSNSSGTSNSTSGASTGNNNSTSIVTTTLNTNSSVITTYFGNSVAPITPSVKLTQSATGKTSISNEEISYSPTLQFSGKASANAVISITLISGRKRTPGISKVDKNGDWIWNPPPNLDSGNYIASFFVQDKLGNTGESIIEFTIPENNKTNIKNRIIIDTLINYLKRIFTFQILN